MQKTMNQRDEHVATGRGHPSEITVRARSSSGTWTFAMQVEGEQVDRVDYSKDRLGLRKHDWHEIDFHLDEPSGELAFHPDKHEAIWVKRGSESEAPPCPTKPSRDHGVVPMSVTARLLRVRNDNAERCLLSFRLNFVAAGTNNEEIVAFLDPIMGNQNGGSANREQGA